MKYLFCVVFVFLSGCSIKNYEYTQTKIIIIKSPKLKFADVGYIRNTDKSVELELFVAGKVVQKFTINHFVCTGEGCMAKSSFNAEYLSGAYPDDILQHIVLGRPIYGGDNLQKTLDGFTQKIATNDVDIYYKVDTKQISFKDTKNNILFKIKDMQ